MLRTPIAGGRPTAARAAVIVLRASPGAQVQLVCLPFAGGGAWAFRSWPALLPPEIDVLAVQPPGREGRIAEVPLRDLYALVENVANGIDALLDTPYALFGHSMGALAAFELCRELRRRGRPGPTHLMVSGYGPPTPAAPGSRASSARRLGSGGRTAPS